MLVTKQPVLRRFWYPVIPIKDLQDGPKPFQLLGENLVLWLDGEGEPVAMEDRCCHRTAKLSCGYIEGGNIVCGYHGWAFDREGQCAALPQYDGGQPPKGARVARYYCERRYGYAWVCLGEPLTGIPEFPKEFDTSFRKIDQFYEVWNCSGLRLMENSFDNAHFSFVHKNTFGIIEQPKPSSFTLTPFEWGFYMDTVVPIQNAGDLQKRALNMEEERTTRTNHSTWWMPFCRELEITYPNGLIHSIVTCATPIDDRSSQVIQFVYRNDTEEEVPAADIIAYDRAVTVEDRDVLETTDWNTPVDTSRQEEFHMSSDQPGILMRKMLLELFHKHGEEEVYEEDARSDAVLKSRIRVRGA